MTEKQQRRSSRRSVSPIVRIGRLSFGMLPPRRLRPCLASSACKHDDHDISCLQAGTSCVPLGNATFSVLAAAPADVHVTRACMCMNVQRPCFYIISAP